MKRLHIIVSGFVQAVGFRYFLYQNAITMPISGWAQNLYDGTVEVEIQGEKENLDEFKKIIKKGSRYSSVENLEITEIPVINGEKEFRIKG